MDERKERGRFWIDIEEAGRSAGGSIRPYVEAVRGRLTSLKRCGPAIEMFTGIVLMSVGTLLPNLGVSLGLITQEMADITVATVGLSGVVIAFDGLSRNVTGRGLVDRLFHRKSSVI